VSDIFVSYSSSDRDWAFWIAHQLEKLGHTPHIHEWEIAAGGNIARWMEERLERADHVLCIVSSEYLAKPYSSWERRAAAWSVASSRPNFVLPVFVEDCQSPAFLAPFKRCDLYGIGEEEARVRLKQYFAPAATPTTPPRFPGRALPSNAASLEPLTFPGLERGSAPHQPRNLPFASLGELFVGRTGALKELRDALTTDQGVAVVGRALVGVGGVGKTRLAVEYAWSRAADYSALLFASAHDPAALDSNLAVLASAEVLDLPLSEATEDLAKIEAVLRWLEANPTWLLILDNVDDENAVAAVGQLMARLKGGHVIITSRSAKFPASIPTFPVSIPTLALHILEEVAATEFLLRRTSGKRERAADDNSKARAIAQELGGLPLALEQAGAHISAQRIGFQRYLKLLGDSHDRMLKLIDRTSIDYSVETAFAGALATSVDRLSPESRRLLERLAMLAPDPIPASLLDVTVPGEAADYDPHRACASLLTDSLVARVKEEGGSAGSYVVHRLVQDFTRRAMSDQRHNKSLQEALAWVDAAFVGDPQDERSWPVLDPLTPHALAVAQRADDAGIFEPTAGLFNKIGLVLNAKGRVREAEPLIRRALVIHEVALGPDHPQVAATLNNLANLFQDKGRYAEAEPLYRRALAIYEASLGPNYPGVATGLNNLAQLLVDTGRFAEAEPLMRRALDTYVSAFGEDHPAVALSLSNLATLLQIENRPAEAEPLYRRALEIREKSLGPEHPSVATILNNLANLLRDTNRLAEAEPLYRRVIAIFEKSLGSDHPSAVRARDNIAALASARRSHSRQRSATK
jgi:tetratricopeptide (TPR) repeat protein